MRTEALASDPAAGPLQHKIGQSAIRPLQELWKKDEKNTSMGLHP